tara:strand:- start:3209 stop:4222 length:1014 start_codon:yes stop_codon:yes gene_type:complete
MCPAKRKGVLPPYVYKRSKSYVMRIYLGLGEPMKSVVLCPITAPISEVWAQYEKHQTGNIKNLRWLLTEYSQSPSFIKKAPATQTLQNQQIETLCSYKTKTGKPFGEAEIKRITSGTIRQYLDAREADNAPVAGNRERSLLSSAWNWALERDITKIPNPCSVVKRNEEFSRTRYVTEDEFQIAYELAITTPYLRPSMELAYLCRMRRSEILNATRAQILKEGFDTKRIKGSKDAITTWTDRLVKAVNYKASNVDSVFIVHTKTGQKVTKEAFKSAWTRLKKKMVIAGIEPFNFHDLKAAGVSDVEGTDEDRLDASGHRDRKMLKVYDRKKRQVKATR